MELPSLNTLKNEVEDVLDLFKSAIEDRDELAGRLRHIEAELEELRRLHSLTQSSTFQQSEKTLDTDKETKIREKVNELLAILEKI